jgi:hypothetical protein
MDAQRKECSKHMVTFVHQLNLNFDLLTVIGKILSYLWVKLKAFNFTLNYSYYPIPMRNKNSTIFQPIPYPLSNARIILVHREVSKIAYILEFELFIYD